MRTISEIKDTITVEFMNREEVAQMYGFTPGASFTATFSRVSLENILFSIFAGAAWVMEGLFGTHKAEVNDIVANMTPHRPKWYRDKALAFMVDKTLVPDTDYYDTSDMSDDQIESAKVVKHAVATENDEASILTIKIAGENGGMRGKLSDATEVQILSYLNQIKDAGVRISLVNRDPDTFNCMADIYYDAILVPDIVKEACQAAIKTYIENLPFNGEYTNMALVDVLQQIDGVKIVEIRQASTSTSVSGITADITSRYVPQAGYFAVGAVTINMIPYA